MDTYSNNKLAMLFIYNVLIVTHAEANMKGLL